VKKLFLYTNKPMADKAQKANDRPLKVVQMLPELESGGVERGTLEMGKYLAISGHHSIVISGGGRMVKQLEQEGSKHIRWPVGSKSPRCLASLPPLRKLLLHERVDVLHLRSRMPAWVGYVTWLSLPQKMRPLLVTTFHGYYSLNAYSGIMTKGDCIIAVSEGIREHISKNYKVRGKLKTIFRGVDQVTFAPERVEESRVRNLHDRWGMQKGAPVVMLPGRISRNKGHDVFLKSLLEIKKEPFQAILVGDCDEDNGFIIELRNFIQSSGLAEQVKLVGHCDDMPAAYMLADIIVSASSKRPEAFGRTTIEAMAMGKPVIATSHGGSVEIVKHGENGWLVPPSNPEEMGKQIASALKKTDSLVEMGKKGMKHVHECFSTDSMCESTLKIYRELLEEREYEQ
jgi:glycosyltransferase involved in cell wall biosynthesis